MFSKARHIFHSMAMEALHKAESAAAFLQKLMRWHLK
jgi:hypothetical protein